MRTLRVSAAAPKHSIRAAARPESPPCYQLSPCIIIVHFFSTESGMMKLIGFMLGTDVLPSAQMLRVAPSCWCSSPVRFFCTLIWSVSGLKGSWDGWKIMLSFHRELGASLEGVRSRHPGHFAIHLLQRDTIPFLFENCLGSHFIIKHSDACFSGCFPLQLIWQRTVLFSTLFSHLSLLGIHGSPSPVKEL